MTPTIFAVSSGRPPAGIAVIRISGPGAFAAGAALAGTLPPIRTTGLRILRDAAGGVLDEALVLAFAAPRTATGEDIVELHCHGGRAVIDAIERTLGSIDGLRHAKPGEFTRRALANGRIDLAEAQGLADLLAAETERQRIAALAAADGRISDAVHGWMDRVALLSARVEAMLDFADEDDVEDDGGTLAAVVGAMAALAADIDAAIDAPPVERLRDGIRVVIGGPPNSGKSTLINLLAEREVAIVSPIAGTTRDRIEATVMRDGIPYVIGDTAGLTETDDPIERIGVRRAADAIATADIVLWMGDDPPPYGAIWIHGRCDLPDRLIKPQPADIAITATSAVTIADLWSLIHRRAERLVPAADRLAWTRSQQDRCRTAAQWLVDTAVADDPIVIAEHLRHATRSLAAITGADATDAMLDALFNRFCIGK